MDALFRRKWFLVAMAAGPLLLAACTGQQGGGAPAPGDGGGTGQPAVNRVVLAIDPPTAEANENRMLGQTTSFQLNPMYEYLIGYDANNGKFVPALATEWTLLPDSSGYRMKLRQGVQFQKGNGEFTAADVKFTWEDLTREGSTHGESTWYRTHVTEIEAPNNYEVVFKLTPGSANFIHGVSRAEHVFEIISKAHYDKAGPATMTTEPTVGTGPYQYKERSQGNYIRYERRPDIAQHWAKYQIDFPEFEYRFQKEASTRLAALLTGEVHMAALPEDLKQRAEADGFKVLRGKVAGPRAFFNIACCFIKDPKDLNSGYLYPDSPLMDLRVRKALNKAINRDELNKAFFGGRGEMMYHAHLHPTRPGWNPEWERNFRSEYGYDPEASRRLLAEAGYGPSRPLRTNLHVVSLPNVPGSADVIEAVAQYFRAVGVEPNLVQMDSAERAAQTRALRFSNDLFLSGTSSGELIGTNAYWSSILPRGAGMEDPKGDAILLKINDELDEKKADALWREYGDWTYSQHYALPLFWIPAEVVVNPKVVADWVFPGSITGTWTHQENLRAVK